MRKVSVLTICLVVFLATSLFAQMGMRGGEFFRCGYYPCNMGSYGVGYERMAKNLAFKEIKSYLFHTDMLGLTEEQVTKLEDIKYELATDLIKKHSDLKLAFLDHKRLMSQEIPNIKEVLEQINKITKLRKEIHIKVIEAIIEARNVLTKEQRQKAKKALSFYKFKTDVGSDKQ
jgi:hypothetical protein